MNDIHLKGNEWQGFWTKMSELVDKQSAESITGKILNLPDREFLRVLAESGIGVISNKQEVKNAGTKTGN